MGDINNSVVKAWSDYLKSIGDSIETTNKHYAAWHFCDNENDANKLAQLVINGTKKATASLKLVFENDDEEIPKAGDYSVITDYNGVAKCIIMTSKIEIVPYKDVTAEFAAIEGEGDRSLEFWKRVHWDFFSREMKSMGKEMHENVLVVCEQFEVVYTA